MKSQYCIKCDHESSSFRKRAKTIWISRIDCDCFLDQFSLVTINSNKNLYLYLDGWFASQIVDEKVHANVFAIHFLVDIIFNSEGQHIGKPMII